jgi:hypothetical protein
VGRPKAPGGAGLLVQLWVWDQAAVSVMTALPSRITMCWPVSALRQGESAEFCDVLHGSQTVIDLADGDPSKGNFVFGSPLAVAFMGRGAARYWLGRPGWRDGLRRAVAMARSADPLSYATDVTYAYLAAIPNGVLTPDDRAVHEIEDALRIADRSADDLALAAARRTLGIARVHRPTDPERDRGRKTAGRGQRRVAPGAPPGRLTACERVFGAGEGSEWRSRGRSS